MAWITDGESGADVRAKLNALAIPIESGTISAPVEYLDIDFPSGYAFFLMYFADLAFSTTDNLYAIFSADGGSTWIGDFVNHDTYEYTVINAPDAPATGVDSLANVSASLIIGTADETLFNLRMQITPGSAVTYPEIYVDGFGKRSTPSTGISIVTLYKDATVTPTAQRISAIRFMPYGSDDNPPTSAQTFTGKYFLYGVPTP